MHCENHSIHLGTCEGGDRDQSSARLQQEKGTVTEESLETLSVQFAHDVLILSHGSSNNGLLLPQLS